jgi:hypothetical protein
MSQKTNISIIAANMLALPILAVASAALIGPYWALWGLNAVVDAVDTSLSINGFMLLAGLFASIGLHELLHGVGFRYFAGLPWRDIKFGIHWKVFTPYASATKPMSVNAYRGSAILPCIVMGLVPAVAGIALQRGSWLLYGTFMTMAAGGDMLVVWMTRGLSSETMVRDCAAAVGCEVVTETSAESSIAYDIRAAGTF